jgi:hypothetical protein
MFVPFIMSSGGNSGSQAATLIIRAMALKELIDPVTGGTSCAVKYFPDLHLG